MNNYLLICFFSVHFDLKYFLFNINKFSQQKFIYFYFSFNMKYNLLIINKFSQKKFIYFFFFLFSFLFEIFSFDNILFFSKKNLYFFSF
jgi:hypothetical protein